jgi:dinuclear metal center YbgI/SA1388 family protein
LIVHHGIRWRPRQDSDLLNKRMAYLKKNFMALYAAHLPLDLHEEYGNNVQLALLLGVRKLRKFGRYHGVKIGTAGVFKEALSLSTISEILDARLNTKCLVYQFGKRHVRSIGIISGGGGSMLGDAVKERLDCFVVGDIDLAVYNAAKDHEISVITAGHYATETAGVRALMTLLRSSFDVKTVFIDDQKDL